MTKTELKKLAEETDRMCDSIDGIEQALREIAAIQAAFAAPNPFNTPKELSND